MHYIGLMSGTSADAIDAVLVTLPARGALTLLASHSHPIPEKTKQTIHSLAVPGTDEIDRLGTLHTELGDLFAAAALAVLRAGKLTAKDVRAIGSHGQTVRHRPTGKFPFSLQIGNPSVIAERTGITTVADLRARDLAAGGQGAPLVPAFHQFLFHARDRHRAIVNIGGIANVTYLPASNTQPVLGFDTGPGNTLLDTWIRQHLGKTHDANGQWAGGGHPSDTLLEKLLADPYFAAPPPKSTGREQFHSDWLTKKIPTGLRPQDVQATLAELTARGIADAIRRFLPACDEVFVCGGGAHNRDLMERLRARLKPLPLATTDALGLAPDWVEATAFAWLAHQTLEGQPGNIPSVTGAQRPVVLGGIYKA